MQPHMQDMKVWDRKVWAPDITKPLKKALNSPLYSTFLHSYPIEKISVRNIKPPNLHKRYQISLPNPICEGIQSICLVGYGAICLWGYKGLLTMGVLRSFLLFPPISGMMNV